ncbi:MAG TPA: hypothetical protein VIS76_08530, partial [Pseudomonadales bacterium]
MLSDRDPQNHPADWYLIASRGDLVLRLARDLQIGEDGLGGIVLSPSAADALLRISISGDELTLRALAIDWTFCDADGSTRQHLTFPAGTTIRLNFPDSSLVITPHFLAGPRARPDRVIDLRPITPPALALSRLAEPVPEPAAAPAPTPAPAPAPADSETQQQRPHISEATTEEIAALLEATTDDLSERLLSGDHDVPDEIPPQAPAEPLAAAGDSAQPATPVRALTAVPPSRDGTVWAEPSRAPETAASVPATKPRTGRRRARQARARHLLLATGLALLAMLTPMAI